MLQCKEVVGLVASDEWRTAPWTRRLAVSLHLAMCRHCRAYTVSLRQLGSAARRLYRNEPVDPDRAADLLRDVRDAAERSRGS